MKQQVEYTCDIHSDLSDCPDALVAYSAKTGDFGLRIHDGGSSVVTIQYCPWCGTHLAARSHLSE